MNDQLIANITHTQKFFNNKMATEIYHKNGVYGWVTNIDCEYLNGVISANIKDDLVYSNVKEVISFFKSKNVPWVWNVTPICQPSNLEEVLVDNKFKLISEYQALWYDLNKYTPNFSFEKYDIREVLDDNALNDWNIPLDEGFGADADNKSSENNFFKLIAKIPYGNNNSFHHYVAYKDNKPVACATLSVSKYGARIDNVATCNDYLRQGYAKAITLFAMNAAKKMNCKMVCLEASDVGLLLYLNIGFEVVYLNKLYRIIN
jgi:hypothetical protein